MRMDQRRRCWQRLCRGAIAAAGLAILQDLPSAAQAQIAPTPFRDAREALSDDLRRTGKPIDQESADLEARITRALAEAPANERAAYLYDLGAIRRLRQDFPGALAAYAQTRAEAGPADSALVFDAWIGTARTYALGLNQHGQAAEALARAAEIAGTPPSDEMAYDLASFGAEIDAIRGDVEAALVHVLGAQATARSPLDRFYAAFDKASIFQQFAQRCDYEPLIDALTFETDPLDIWGGCRRAVDRAAEGYRAARDLAREQGWNAFAAMLDGFLQRLELRRELIAAGERQARMLGADRFDGGTVLVEERFPSGASELADMPWLTALIDSVGGEATEQDPRGQWLRGVRAQIAGDEPAALDHFTAAARLLATERASFADLRHSGITTEEHPEVVRDLGLRLLALNRPAEALTVFESQRAEGLSQLAQAFRVLAFSGAERALIADLLEAGARLDRVRRQLVEDAIATGTGLDPGPALARIAQTEDELAALQRLPAAQALLQRIRAVPPPPAMGLDALQAAIRESKVPVLAYWTTPTYVVVTAIAADRMATRAIFLPREPLLAHLDRIRDGTRSAFSPFPQASARALYAFLIAPVAEFLNGPEILIVPQGPLVGLPFEALIDPRTGKSLVETHAVSYAPNLDFARRALDALPARPGRMTAIIDPAIATGEAERLPSDWQPRRVPSDGLTSQQAIAALSDSQAVHVLLHGRFDDYSPLLSGLTVNPRTHLSAARLIAADWSGTRLAVFSSCEGAQTQVRLSGEVFGLSWPLLAAGAQAIVMSRWRVMGTTNADWIGDFYAALGRTGRPSLAAAEAARAMIARGRGHPFYWAGPQVIGR